ncbi:hypothetical protein LF41_546 [Lysobacter dokdonensis DS-58]|uniref:Uncharacterized protein n=1 Tax=Lysobacter dokdonensis DS-58 TaxID=1300345 RepID=A0A0A2WE85_9GAMM|nr:hypothetical protein LF41_546 [Lysobacter dokdonensis DS-58]
MGCAGARRHHNSRPAAGLSYACHTTACHNCASLSSPP